jgi:ribosomal protein S27E
MAKTATHAITGSGGDYCRCCSSAVGEAVKSQPTRVDGETWCARCFVWIRAHKEPNRFNSSYTVAVRCLKCGWHSVCFSAGVGMRATCGHCGWPGVLPLPMTADDQKELRELAQAFAEKTRA